MKVVKRKISELIPADYNPRRLTEKQEKHLTESLTEFGLVDPVIVNMNSDRKNIIIGGHQRLKVWQKLGNKEIDCVELDLSIEKEKELNIRLNANTGEWDIDLLLGEWEQFELESWGLTLEWPEEPIEIEEDDFDVDGALSEEPETVLGDLYEIGEHRLLCGDSTDSDQVAKLMNGEKADMVMTDPPYNVAYEGGTGLTIMNDEMDNDSFYTFLLLFYKAFADVTKDGGAWYVWHADSEGVNFRKAFQESGLLLKQCLIWVKNALVMGRQDYHWKHEPCLYGWKAGAAHYFTSDRTKTTVIEDKLDIKKLKKDELLKLLTEVMSDKTKTTVIHHDKPLKNGEHPTMKPILLLAPLIENSSKPKWIVGDPFLGSGSTMVASHQLKRRCYGLELDPKYCDVTVNRMIKLDPDLRIKRNGVDITNEWN